MTKGIATRSATKARYSLGCTLIELPLVIVVIAMLASMLLPIYPLRELTNGFSSIGAWFDPPDQVRSGEFNEDSVSGDPLIITRDKLVEVLERQPKALG